jgi:hypothetical protein
VHDLLLAVVASDGAELQEVSTNEWLNFDELTTVFEAAPQLQLLKAFIRDHCMPLLPCLRNEPPYGPLRVSVLDVGCGGVSAVDVQAFAAAVAAHESVGSLVIRQSDFPRGLIALLDAAAERLVSCLSILDCAMDAESTRAVTRHLQRNPLITLEVKCTGFPYAQEESVPALCSALRASHDVLMNLVLKLNPHGGATPRVVTELVDAATALPELSCLHLSNSVLQDTAAAGRAFGALLRANLPNLTDLILNNCRIGEEGMAALLDGLEANTHLRKLECGYNNVSEAFKRDRLEPALAALGARAELDARARR